MIRAAIVEDNEQDRLNLKKLLEVAGERFQRTFDVSFFGSADAFLLDYKAEYDIVFMDIEMPNLDGMTAAKRLREIDPAVLLVFVTNMAQMAIRGYEVEALDFLVKPLVPDHFLLKMTRILQHVKPREGEFVRIVQDGVTYSVRIDSIRYYEVDGHYIVYHTDEREYREYSSLSSAMKKAAVPYFEKCNRGTIVNLYRIDAVYTDSLVIEDATISISRSIRKDFMKRYIDFLGGKHA